MVQKISKKAKIDHCNVCNGALKPEKDVILGVELNVFKCPDCGEVEVPFLEALKAEKALKAATPAKA